MLIGGGQIYPLLETLYGWLRILRSAQFTAQKAHPILHLRIRRHIYGAPYTEWVYTKDHTYSWYLRLIHCYLQPRLLSTVRALAMMNNRKNDILILSARKELWRTHFILRGIICWYLKPFIRLGPIQSLQKINFQPLKSRSQYRNVFYISHIVNLPRYGKADSISNLSGEQRPSDPDHPPP